MTLGFDLVEKLLPFRLDLCSRAGRLAVRIQDLGDLLEPVGSLAQMAGRYKVLVCIPERYSTTSSARYWVANANGFTQRAVDQSANGGGGEYVSLSDVAGEQRLTRLIAFDAVKWAPR